MPMHSPRRERGSAPARSGGVATAALPLLAAAVGMVVIGTALILNVQLLVLAGAGLVVVAAAMFLMAVLVNRGEAVHTRRRAPRDDGDVRRDLPARGALADAAVDALTNADAPGGIWPPLSSKGKAMAHAPRGGADAVTMWDPHAKVAPAAFHEPGPGAQGAVADASRVAHEAPVQRPVQAETQGWVEFSAVSQEERIQAPVGAAATPGPGAGGTVEGQRDLRLWPGAKDLGGWDRLSSRADEDRLDQERRTASMRERRERLAERLPTVGAILASPERDEEPPRNGATRGKCSSCQQFLWAPPGRPVTLKCPNCGHKARLY